MLLLQARARTRSQPLSHTLHSSNINDSAEAKQNQKLDLSAHNRYWNMRHTNLHINIVKQPAKTTHWLFDFSFPSNGCSNRFRYLILMYNDEQAVCNDAKQNLHFTAHTSLFQSISTVRASWASCFRYLLRFWFEFLFVFTSILYFVRFKCILTLCYNIRIYSYALEKNVNCAKYIF